MARKVTVTFDNGAQHTYEDVPDSATPESVLERTRRDFGNRGVTNIDGGREKGGRDYVMDLGKSVASAIDVVASIPGGIAGEVAYAGGRAFGQTPEKASALREVVTGATTDPIGQALGITQDPAYQNEALRRGMGAVGQGIQTAAAPVAQMTGLPQQDVENMMGTLLAGVSPAAGRAAAATGRGAVRGAQAVGRGAAEVARAPVNFGKGFYEGVMNPEPTPSSALVPLQKQAYPAQAGRDFVAGRMSLPELEASRVPSASLFSGRLDQAALKALPKNTAGQPMVPLAGRGMEAVGENLGRGYRTQPLQAAADLGLMSLGVPPIGPAARAAQGVASLRASKAADFTPGFTERLGQAQTQAALAPNPQLRLPAPGAAPAPGPVNPATMYAGAGGVSTDLPAAGRAALDVRYPPMPAATPKEMAQQAAAERIMPPTTDLQARAQTAFGSQYRPPAAEQAPVAPVAPQTVPKPMVETPAPAVSGPVAPAAMPEPVATPPAPVVQSTMKPTEKRITFDELAADVVGAKEFGIVHDIKNKTRTEPGASPDTMPSDMRGVLPKDVKWEKSVEHWLPDGSDVAFTEYYTAKTTKNSPVYKYVEPETGDGVLYKQGTGNNWTKVDSMEFPVPKGVLKATEGRAAVQAALDSGKQATIKYKTSAGIITEHVNKTAKVKFDSDLSMNHTIVRPDSTTLFGTKKSSGIPVKIEMMDLSKQSANPEFIKVFDNSKPKSPVLMATYDQNGTLTSTPTPSKKAPPGITNMMTEEQLKVFNALKRSESTSSLLRQLKDSGDPNAKSLAELLEKQGYNNKNK